MIVFLSQEVIDSIITKYDSIDSSHVTLDPKFAEYDSEIDRIGWRIYGGLQDKSESSWKRLEIEDQVRNLAGTILRRYSTITREIGGRTVVAGKLDPHKEQALREFTRVYAMKGQKPEAVDMASELGMSEQRFRDCLYETYHLTPIQYYNEERAKCVAERLERDPSYALADAAYDFGYCDQPALTRHTKRYIHKTPGAIKKKK